jgi:AAA domain
MAVVPKFPAPSKTTMPAIRKSDELTVASPAIGPNGEDEPAFKATEFQPGHSLRWYAAQPIDHTQTLLGNRYLCRSGGMFIVGPSGMGKSTFSVQIAILWSCGLAAFGIKPSKALRILIVQSEDDQGDCTEMAKIADHLTLSEEQKKLVEENTELIRCNDLVGFKFIQALRVRLAKARDDGKPFDLVIINPFGVFLGKDPKDAEACSQFLNEWLNPVLSEFAIGAIPIHHTPKTTHRDTTEWKPSDWMYSGAGAACITNWARAYLVIDPCETHGLFKFIAAKRGRRIGWGTSTPVYETFWAHSDQEGQLLWVPANQDQLAADKEKSKSLPQDLLRLIPVLDPILQEQLFLIAAQKGIGRNKTRDFLKILIHEEKCHIHKIPRPGAKSAIGYAQTPPGQEE